MNADRLRNMLALLLFRHLGVVDPAQAVGSDLIVRLLHRGDGVRVLFQRFRDAEDGHRQLARRELRHGCSYSSASCWVF